MKDKFKPSDLKSKEVLKTILAKELEELSKSDQETKIKKNEDLRELIKYYFELNNATDEKSAQICNFSLQYLVLCAIALGILIMHFSIIIPVVFTSSFSFLAVQILYLLLIAISYESSTRSKNSLSYDFGHNDQVNPDFFLEKKKNIIQLIIEAMFHSKKNDSAPRAYFEGLRCFARNYWEENVEQKILNNLEQLYMLQAQNAYINRIFHRLKRLRFWSLVVAILSAALIFLIFYIYLNFLP